VRVALVGGTGAFGKALATRLRDVDGFEVVIGSRDAERAKATATGLGVEGAANDEAVRRADLVVLATKANAALETAKNLRASIGATPVLSVASEVRVTPNGVFPSSETLSLAEQIDAELDAPVLAGLHSLAASTLGGGEPPDEDALVCGDDADAKALGLELAEQVTAGRAVDAGPLASARALEGLTAVLVGINKRYKTHAGLKVTGLG
jgi:8-hydroxy-5-deazaflavin:NADPH oxidoreductase